MFTDEQIGNAVGAVSYPWSVGDDVLYDLCERFLDHSDVKVVVAKLWMIGRAYSAAIERLGKPEDLTTSDLYARVAESMISSDVDRHIQKLRGLGPLSEGNAQEVIASHKYLADTLRANTGKYPRSLASKYLHFHAPEAVPIFDSYTQKTICESLPRWCDQSGLSRLDDKDYSSFVARVINVLDRIEREHGTRLTVKQLDRLLWIEGEGRALRNL
jgi:hypothetical protein